MLMDAMAFRSMGCSSRIQELYERCNMVFCGYEGLAPSQDEILWLKDLLAKVEAVDVGVDGSDEDDGDDDDNGLVNSRRLMSGSRVEHITYIHIYECDEFSIGVFCFPAGATLPLHDHPEMVVLSRVLYGSVLQRAYDWVRPPDPKKKCGLARLVVDDKVLTSSSQPSVLFPASGGNLHSFTALTPCAFLDVLSPPYSEEDGRPSTYYSEISIPCVSGFSILKAMDVPDDLVVVGAPYLGPQLVVEEGGVVDDDEDDYF